MGSAGTRGAGVSYTPHIFLSVWQCAGTAAIRDFSCFNSFTGFEDYSCTVHLGLYYYLQQ